MRTVYRYKMAATSNEIELPAGSTPIAVAINGKVAIEGKVINAPEDVPEGASPETSVVIPVLDLFVNVPDTDATVTKRTFLNVSCGQALPEKLMLQYVGTAVFPQHPARVCFEQLAE